MGLLLIGLAHSILIWFGDILVTYAVLGFGLIPFLRRSDRVVLRWAFAMLALPIVIYTMVLRAADDRQPRMARARRVPPGRVAVADVHLQEKIRVAEVRGATRESKDLS